LVVIAMALACSAPAVASAQGTSAPQGFVGGLGGVTFGTVTSAAVAGQGGVRIARDLYVIGEVGYMRNVLPKKIRDQFDDLVDEIENEAGVPVSLTVSIPAKYGFGGLRWSPSRGTVSPFVEGGVGVAHVSAKVDEAKVLGIDISRDVEDELGDDASVTKLLVAVGGGMNARLSSTLSADIGFRYTRIATEEPAINSSLLYGALKIGF
jgi:opacity protein-like surface antigen